MVWGSDKVPLRAQEVGEAIGRAAAEGGVHAEEEEPLPPAAAPERGGEEDGGRCRQRGVGGRRAGEEMTEGDGPLSLLYKPLKRVVKPDFWDRGDRNGVFLRVCI